MHGLRSGACVCARAAGPEAGAIRRAAGRSPCGHAHCDCGGCRRAWPMFAACPAPELRQMNSSAPRSIGDKSRKNQQEFRPTWRRSPGLSRWMAPMPSARQRARNWSRSVRARPPQQNDAERRGGQDRPPWSRASRSRMATITNVATSASRQHQKADKAPFYQRHRTLNLLARSTRLASTPGSSMVASERRPAPAVRRCHWISSVARLHNSVGTGFCSADLSLRPAR